MICAGCLWKTAARPSGIEGVVSKLKGSAYQSWKTTAWRKIKCFEEKQMVIIGVQRERGQAAHGRRRGWG